MYQQDKLLEKIEQAKKNITTREEREKIANEAKILGTAMQKLLPDIFEEKRVIPNCFLRGSLFGMVRKGRRALVGNVPIFTMSQYDLFFTGYELDQNDLELWDTLIYLAKSKKINNELRITLYELCQHMKLPYTSIYRKVLIERVKRLQLGQITIKTNGKQFFGSLIDNGYIDEVGDGKLVIEYNKKLAPLFADNEYTIVSINMRYSLGDNQLARWLYNFYESHNKPMPFSLEFLQKLCRSESEPKEFKRLLKNAVEMIQKAYLAMNNKSKWSYELTQNDYLIVYPKGIIKNQLKFNNYNAY